MYHNKLAAAIKVSGKILREFKDTVYVPFGSEYTILLKNINTVRALVNVYIDNDNVVPGGLVLNAGQECDLARAIRNGNMSEGNKFKFIERTGGVEAHRGIKLEDGIIRVEYQFEKVIPPQIWPHYSKSYYDGGGDTWGTPIRGNNIPHIPLGGDWRGYSVNNIGGGGSSSSSGGVRGSSMGSSYSASLNMSYSVGSIATQYATLSSALPQNDVGITVAGGKSEQRFITASNFQVDPEKFNIILKLLGETAENKAICTPITVKSKPKCVTCGKNNKFTSKFCSGCGTALEIFA